MPVVVEEKIHLDVIDDQQYELDLMDELLGDIHVKHDSKIKLFEELIDDFGKQYAIHIRNFVLEKPVLVTLDEYENIKAEFKIFLLGLKEQAKVSEFLIED